MCEQFTVCVWVYFVHCPVDLVPISNQAGFAPVHVTVVNKSSVPHGTDRSGGGEKSINKCHCCLM